MCCGGLLLAWWDLTPVLIVMWVGLFLLIKFAESLSSSGLQSQAHKAECCPPEGRLAVTTRLSVLLQDSGEDLGSHCVAHVVYHSLYSPD